MKCLPLLLLTLALSSPGFSQVKVKIHEHKKYGAEHLARLEQAKTLIEEVINTDTFAVEVLRMVVSPDNNPDNLTNQQILDRIRAANEEAYPNEPGVIDLYLRMKPIPFYKPFTSVIGYTKPSINYIVTYRGKFKKAELHDLAAHYVHEWTHKLGFDHLDEDTWDNSVPYLVHRIVERLAKYLSTATP